MRIAILLFCGALAFGQDAASTPGTPSQPTANSVPEQRQQSASPDDSFKKYGADLSAGAAIQRATQAAADDKAAKGRQLGALDILSNTYGIDFGPYLQPLLKEVRKNWFSLIPASDQMKKGKLAIEFVIAKNGKVVDMRLVATSGDTSLDRCAWGSITTSNPFPALPKEFPDPYLRLRFRYYYNPDKSDLRVSDKTIPPESAPISSTPSKSGIAVNISSSGDSSVPAGGSRVVIVTVTGTKKKAVKWSISGLGCANSSCGEMEGNLYLAPSAPPDPAEVTLTAVSKADPAAKASITVRVVQPTAQASSKQ